MCGPENPLFTPLLWFARIPFQVKKQKTKNKQTNKKKNQNLKSQSTRPLLRKVLKCWTLQPQFFAQILAVKPPIWKFKYITRPLLQRQKSVRKPHTSKSGPRYFFPYPFLNLEFFYLFFFSLWKFIKIYYF